MRILVAEDEPPPRRSSTPATSTSTAPPACAWPPRLGCAPVAGDPALLERMVADLVENAVRHNRLMVGWRSPPAPAMGGPVVRVANGGRAIPSPQRAALTRSG